MAILTSDLLTAARFVHAFPERGVGDAALRDAIGAAIAQAKQVHGAICVEATAASGANGAPADAIVARPGGGTAAGVRVADCVPLLVADEASGAVAAVHAGWRGVVGGVVGAGMARLLAPADGSRAAAATGPGDGAEGSTVRGASLVAAIGPCIGACCFEVGADVAEAIERASGFAGVVARHAGDKAFVDLRKAVRAQLIALGVADARIDDVPGCTRHEPERFHSFRRDGKDSGRMLAAISPRSYG